MGDALTYQGASSSIMSHARLYSFCYSAQLSARIGLFRYMKAGEVALLHVRIYRYSKRFRCQFSLSSGNTWALYVSPIQCMKIVLYKHDIQVMQRPNAGKCCHAYHPTCTLCRDPFSPRRAQHPRTDTNSSNSISFLSRLLPHLLCQSSVLKLSQWSDCT